jgi:hypothetical protein
MTGINHIAVVILNFCLRISARDITVHNAKNKLRFTFYDSQIAFF